MTIHGDPALVLENVVRHNYGFLKQENIDLLALDKNLRLQQCLIRFQGCRLVCSAQDVRHIIESLEKNGDYCRDVSIPASDPIWSRLGLR